MNVAVIIAGGSGQRMGMDIDDDFILHIVIPSERKSDR